MKELKQRFKEHLFRITYQGTLQPDMLQKLEVVSADSQSLTVRFAAGHRGNELLQLFIEKNLEVTSFNELLPSINEIFIRQVHSSN